MHDIGSTRAEIQPEFDPESNLETDPEGLLEIDSLEADQFEVPSAPAVNLEADPESPFHDEEVDELAFEFLEITNDEELDQFIGKVFKKAAGGLRGIARTVAPALGSFVKGAARVALPIAGKAAGTFLGGPVGGMIGGKLASMAGKAFGLELGGLSPEAQDLEVARRVVRFAGAAARHAARFPASRNPRAVARNAAIRSARRYLPGLVRPRRRRPRPPVVPPNGVANVRTSVTNVSPYAPVAMPVPMAMPAPAPPDAEPPPDVEPAQDAEPPQDGDGQCACEAPSQSRGHWVRRGTKIVIYGV